MKCAALRVSPEDVETLTHSINRLGGRWVQFGDDVFVYATNRSWDAVERGVSARAAPLKCRRQDVRKPNMHLVVQKGRTFQVDHPEVPVLYDKGRYLVVDIDPATVDGIGRGEEPCYQIQPLPENQVVFKTLVRPAARMEPDTGMASVAQGLDTSAVECDLQHLVVSYPTRFSMSNHFREAADWAADRLGSLGYQVRLETVGIGGSGESRNVIATKPSSGDSSAGQVLVVGHLDSVNQRGDSSAPAPGADDNASGSCGVLEIARVLSEREFSNDLTFVLFGGEEQGLYGSRAYVASLAQTEREKIVGVLNMDMIGSRNTTEPTVLLEGAPSSQDLIDRLADAAMTYTNLQVQTSLSPYASDHVPFLNAGIPAVLTIEGADDANSAVHTADDVLSGLDTELILEILKMNVVCIATLAGYQQPCEVGADCGCGGTCPVAPDGGGEILQGLATHYQHLFALYRRLHNEGRLQSQDYAAWQEAQRLHEAWIGPTLRPPN